MRSNKYNKLEELFKIDIPKEIINYWENYEKQNIENRYFYYKYFGKIIPLTPDRIQNISYSIPQDLERHSIYNRLYGLKRDGKITQEQENEIISKSHHDLLLIYINLKNTLFKKYSHNNYIKYAIPIAFTFRNSTEILIYGFTESKEPEGIFLYDVGPNQLYPLYLCKNLHELQQTTEYDLEAKLAELENRIEENFIYRVKLNEEYEIDDKELKDIVDFIKKAHKKIFGKEIQITRDDETIELKFDHRSVKKFVKIETKELKYYDNLMYLISGMNNAISEPRTKRPENYYYALGEKTIQILHKETLVEFMRNGLIEPYWFNSLPSIAYCSKPIKYKGKHDDKLLKIAKEEGWDNDTINTFLNDFRDS